MNRLKEIPIGTRFGALTTTSSQIRYEYGKWGYEVICDCGKKKYVQARALYDGKATSCGCGANRYIGDAKSSTRLYNIWRNMLDRCNNTLSKNYNGYGGRGILVCSEWMDFDGFKKWALKNGYKESLTIERIDNDGDYAPYNCRWATIEEQSYNKRTTIRVTIDGITMCLAEATKIHGIRYETARKRIVNLGWDPVDAILTPTRTKKGE